MSLSVSDKGGGDFKPVPAGTHRAICTMIADMGVQPSARFAPKPKVYIRFELPDEVTEWTDKEGNRRTGPMVIGKQYTASLSEKANLRRDLEGWRGRLFTEAELKKFDLKNILGAPAMIGVTHNVSGGKTYANLASIMGLAKGMDKPKPSGDLIAYDIDTHDETAYQKLPGWLQEAIKDRVANDSDKTVQSNGSSSPEFDDDIPF
jgi:hypothetical protein